MKGPLNAESSSLACGSARLHRQMCRSTSKFGFRYIRYTVRQAHRPEQLVSVKIEALVRDIPQTFQYGNAFARDDVGGHARLRIGLNEAQAHYRECESPANTKVAKSSAPWRFNTWSLRWSPARRVIALRLTFRIAIFASTVLPPVEHGHEWL
jgi:hypothetical protein